MIKTPSIFWNLGKEDDSACPASPFRKEGGNGGFPNLRKEEDHEKGEEEKKEDDDD